MAKKEDTFMSGAGGVADGVPAKIIFQWKKIKMKNEKCLAGRSGSEPGKSGKGSRRALRREKGRSMVHRSPLNTELDSGRTNATSPGAPEMPKSAGYGV